MQCAFALSLLSVICCARLATAASEEPRRPNIIYIMADDLGFADLGCYGQREILTPNVDRLAAEGRRFTQCYAGSTVCAPSRSCLMTGLHTGHTTVRDNFAQVGGLPPQGRLPPSTARRSGPIRPVAAFRGAAVLRSAKPAARADENRSSSLPPATGSPT